MRLPAHVGDVGVVEGEVSDEEDVGVSSMFTDEARAAVKLVKWKQPQDLKSNVGRSSWSVAGAG